MAYSGREDNGYFNLALLNTSLAMSKSSADIEQILKEANSVSEIRKKVRMGTIT